MSEKPTPPPGGASAPERAHLEQAHHEICTALTVLRSNVDLVRVDLRRQGDTSTEVMVHRHLSELDLAVERLRSLAAQIRGWHQAGHTELPADK